MINHIEALIAECDQLIRSGQAAQVTGKLSRLNAARIARKWRLPLATICRRAGLVTLGLRVLTPAMNLEEKLGIQPPSVQEQAEYAVLLERCGAVSEALRRHQALDPSSVPEIHLFRSFCHFKRWDYELALPELEAYVARDLAPYARLVGQMNLAAALNATEKLGDASTLLAEIFSKSQEGGHHRLQANALEVMSEVAIKNGDLARAEILLSEAIALFGDAEVQDRLFIKIWQTYIQCLRANDPGALLALRQKALRQTHYESAREIDLLALRIRHDEARFRHLCIGTPYPAFQARIRRDLGRELFAEPYLLGDGAPLLLDIQNGTTSNGAALVKGSQPHRVLTILLKDFYKPVSVGGLFAELFPQERFNINTSPNRVRQLVHRLVRWGEENNLPFTVKHGGNGYVFEAKGLSVKIAPEMDSGDSYLLQLRELHRHFPGADGFTVQQAVNQAGISPGTVRRLLQRGIERGLVSKFGASTNTRYYFAA